MEEKTKIVEVMSQLVTLLTPLASEERQRVVRATFTLLGESQPDMSKASDPTSGVTEEGLQGLPIKAKTWMSQQGISTSQLHQVFDIRDGQVEVIASDLPGNGDKGKTLNAYILQGIRGLLSTGEPTFEDKAARQFCKNLGCYNEANHASYMKGQGNKWIGSKDSGWRLTAPGLKQGADLIKEIASKSE